VIAKLQRRLENTARHIVGIVDHLEGAKKDTKRMEDTLVWIYRKLAPLLDATSNEICATIEHKIPTRLRREAEATDLVVGDGFDEI
jgi:hypothetical protein